MALNFPSSPTIGQVYESGGKTFTWDGTSWVPSTALAAPFYENATTVSANYTVTTGMNAMTAGPITIDPGVVVIVPSGQTWTIV